MNIVNILKIVIASLVILVSYWYGRNIPFKDQIIAYDALRNTSAIIFAVMGAWIAIVYPNALTKIFGNGSQDEKDIEYQRIRTLITPMICSTGIISVILVAVIGGPIVKQVHWLTQFYKEIRGLSYGVIGGLTVLQIVAIILTLVPGYSIQADIERFRKKEDRTSRLHSRVSKK